MIFDTEMIQRRKGQLSQRLLGEKEKVLSVGKHTHPNNNFLDLTAKAT